LTDANACRLTPDAFKSRGSEEKIHCWEKMY
jgi:hypothetical protein